MTPALLTFYAAAAVALLAGLAALVGRDPARATRALALAVLAVMVVEALLVAPLVAIISGVATAAAVAVIGAVASLGAADTRPSPDATAAPSPSSSPPAPAASSPPASSSSPATSSRPLANFIANLKRRRSSASPEAPAATPVAARRRRLVLAVAAATFLTFVLTGTWARQLAWPGHQLAGDAGFGGLRELASALAGHHLVLALALPLLIAIAAIGGAAILDDARAEEQE